MEHRLDLATRTQISVNDASCTVNGSEFHSSGPDTEKLLLPYLAALTRGTARSPCVAERR